MTLDQFRTKVEDFITKKGMKPTAFGRKFASDPRFVFQLRTGREPREATRAKVLEAMTARTPERAQ